MILKKAIFRIGNSVFLQNVVNDKIVYGGVSNAIRQEMEAKVAAGDYVIQEVTQRPKVVPPNWTQFNIEMLSNPNWQSWALLQDIRSALIGASVNGNADGFQSTLEVAKTMSPTSDAVLQEFQEIADRNNVPIKFYDDLL